MIDFDKLNIYLLPSMEAIAREFAPGGMLRGKEYVTLNPRRADSDIGSFSVNIQTGVWKDFSSGEGGKGAISLCMFINSIPAVEAAKLLSKRYNLDAVCSSDSTPVKQSVQKATKAKPWIPIIPVPENAPKPPTDFIRSEDGISVNYPLSHYFPYRTARGQLIGYVTRFEKIDNSGKKSKEIFPLSYCKHTTSGVHRWIFQHLPEPRPLYNLPDIANNPFAIVIMVEGEKKADIFRKLLLDNKNSTYIVSSWIGGCKAVKQADLSPLEKRTVYLWPDNDRKLYPKSHAMAGQEKPKEEQGGWLASLEMAERLKTIASVKIIDPPGKSKPDTWDVDNAINDDKWSLEAIIDFINDNIIDPPEPKAPETASDTVDESLFRCLGFDRGIYYYLPSGTEQISAIKAESHSASALLTLAPIEYWRRCYPGPKQGIDWQTAASDLLCLCQSKRVFDPDKCRGRGAWIDEDRIVVHLGSRLIVDGKETRIMQHKSQYIYEAGSEIRDNLTAPLETSESSKVLEFAKTFFWKDPSFAYLAAGSAVLGPICGALNWRPHIFVSGGAGTGKSTFLKLFLKPLIGPFLMFAYGDSSTTGLRQHQGSSALYVMLEESEAENVDELKEFQNKLKLARISSSETGAKLYKGTQSHKSISFDPRSMFCFSSIGVNVSQKADSGRISIGELYAPQNMNQAQLKAHFLQLAESLNSTFTPSWCGSLRARTIQNIRTIIYNSNIFISLITEMTGSRRDGDQYGTLLAGAYSLLSTDKITADQAISFIKQCNFTAIKESQTELDEKQLLSYILQYPLKTNTEELCVEEIIQRIILPPGGVHSQYELSEEQLKYVDLLKRWGIRVERHDVYRAKWDSVWFSDSHNALGRLLEKTRWAKGWGRTLQRIDGATTKQAMRFTGSNTRATGIPLRMVFTEEDS